MRWYAERRRRRRQLARERGLGGQELERRIPLVEPQGDGRAIVERLVGTEVEEMEGEVPLVRVQTQEILVEMNVLGREITEADAPADDSS